MAELIGASRLQFAYDARLGQFRDLATGRAVSRAKVLNLVDQESTQLAIRMQGHTRLLTQGRIDLPEWQRRCADELKMSHLRIAVLASGGKTRITSQQYGVVGRELRTQYEFLVNFSQDLKDGKLTKEQAVARAGFYGKSARTTFHKVEKVTRAREGFVEAKRSLDAGAMHCPSCISYDTQGLWLPLEQVIVPTVNCECFHFCRCVVAFRRKN